ncbi:AAA family ATPase [Actinophytocola algeriensis]|uniref:Broad-specificity NMP kinase n=1 Tax=Actinophytocola algeriensis TaxID=1768010 RepID=A0A7W7QDX2_9PSEU|nr:AAA family ATPase [Actinophytocola algeriensis]MBB4911785.1 broad-specificity NMP kinase [Actinophytocola algeriensis]MBE1477723.1 broad-specificity NMP kinase [Actinophytocola algeriensis]
MICAGCGHWTDEPRVEIAGAGTVLVCVECGHREPYRRLPLFAVTGPSGTGKSTVGRVLVDRLADECVIVEQDLLWVGALRDPTGDSEAFRQTWLRLAASLQQSGRPVVLCGTVVPPQFEGRPERALFSDIHYLALVCDVDVLRARLRARPAWRGWDEARIDEMLDFAEWVRTEETEPPMTRLDTTTTPVAETADAIEKWVRARLGPGDDRQLHPERVAEHG